MLDLSFFPVELLPDAGPTHPDIAFGSKIVAERGAGMLLIVRRTGNGTNIAVLEVEEIPPEAPETTIARVRVLS